MSLRIRWVRLAGIGSAVFSGVFPAATMSYVGPGAGLSAIGTILALIGALFLALFGFLWYPIKRLLAKRRGRAKASEETIEPPPP